MPVEPPPDVDDIEPEWLEWAQEYLDPLRPTPEERELYRQVFYNGIWTGLSVLAVAYDEEGVVYYRPPSRARIERLRTFLRAEVDGRAGPGRRA